MSNVSKQLDSIFKDIERNESIFTIPTIYNSEYFPDLVKSKLENYYEFISESSFGKKLNIIYSELKDSAILDIKLLSRIKGLIDSINNSINSYYDGLPNKAYDSFSKSLSKIIDFQNHVVISDIEPNKDFYRMRSNIEKPIYKRSEIFHIGFEYRHFCSTQRYSIPGLPSIYLGTTSYLCFKELEEPDITKSYISRYISTKPIKVINIQTIFSFIEDYNLKNSAMEKYESIVKYLLLFPIYLSSTIRVLNSSSSFKTEYIIPQLLMQFISASNTKEHSIHGIKFPSTKLAYNTNDNHLHFSYVFPIVKSNTVGFCSFLSGVFHLSKPKLISDILGKVDVGNSFISYFKSDFAIIDKELLKEKVDDVLTVN